MSNDEEFIYYSEEIGWMLNNIAEMVIIIHKDFQRNGKTHPIYIKEKLSRAKYDLDQLVEMAERKIEENKNKES